MKVHRFFGSIPPNDQFDIHDTALVHQMGSVLKLHVGEQVVLFDGSGAEIVCALTDVGRAHISARVLDRRQNTAEPSREVHVYCSVIKRAAFEWMVEKATEAGATRIVPIVSARTIALGVKEDRLRAIAREAAEQCGRGVVPVIESPMRLKEAFADAAARGAVCICDMGGVMWNSSVTSAHCSLFFGPEGGWDDADRVVFPADATIVSFGPRVFRAETAVAIGTYLAAQ